ncbi:MAG: hypothetical protein HY344_01110 [Candidatus Levybacteria bacterium]|nr:hypothetical protein [Candidatus Levybacteria bacterium]
MSKDDLIGEFIDQGASEKEAEELYLFLKNFKNLLDIKRPLKTKQSFLNKLNKKKVDNYQFPKFPRKFVFVLSIILLFLIVSGSLVGAQASKPGELLYPLKQLTNSVSSFIGQSIHREALKSDGEGQQNSPTPIETWGDNSTDENKNDLKENEKKESKDLESGRDILNKDNKDDKKEVLGVEDKNSGKPEDTIPTVVEEVKDIKEEKKDQSSNNQNSNSTTTIGQTAGQVVGNTGDTVGNVVKDTRNILGL